MCSSYFLFIYITASISSTKKCQKCPGKILCAAAKILKHGNMLEVYSLDAKQNYRLALHLSSQHDHFTSFYKMRVKLAAQTLSHSATIETNCFGSLTPLAKGTAEYAEKVDILLIVQMCIVQTFAEEAYSPDQNIVHFTGYSHGCQHSM